MLSAEQRLDAFERYLRFRSRRGPKDLSRYTNQELVHKASEFLKNTGWPEADTPEGLVERLRQRYARKAAATRSKNTKRRKQAEAKAASAALQSELF